MADSGAPDPKSKIPVAIISGPTASGKSSLTIDMARRFEAEIISADSRQIYRQLKIGTDRLDKDQWQGITHHLMGSVDLGQRFTVFDYVKEAGHIINDANTRKKRIIICGGTGLYIRALTEGIFEIPDDDMTYRQDLLDIVAREGPNYIHRMLMEVDPAEAANIHPHNFIKVIRALEIHHITGRTKSDMMAETRPRHENFVFLHIILLPDREKLYERINRRVDDMVDEYGGGCVSVIADDLTQAIFAEGMVELVGRIGNAVRVYDQRVAHVEVAKLRGGLAHRLKDQGDGALLHVFVGDGERDALPLLIDAKHDEIARLMFAGDLRREVGV